MATPPRLESVEAALLALSSDRLASVTYSADKVTVFTIFGSGTFCRKAWTAAGGPKESVRHDRTDDKAGA